MRAGRGTVVVDASGSLALEEQHGAARGPARVRVVTRLDAGNIGDGSRPSLLLGGLGPLAPQHRAPNSIQCLPTGSD